jgi:hypothetical protein
MSSHAGDFAATEKVFGIVYKCPDNRDSHPGDTSRPFHDCQITISPLAGLDASTGVMSVPKPWLTFDRPD